MPESPETSDHVHRFALRNGDQVLSSGGRDVGDGMHVHTVGSSSTSPDDDSPDHYHVVFFEGVDITGGPPTRPAEAGFFNDGNEIESVVHKSLLPDLVDPEHTYVFYTDEYGVREYWYQDRRGNYWRYSNAPEDHKDYDKFAGVAVFDDAQPLPHTAPQFFTPEGRKRHMGVPQGSQTSVNPAYNPADARNTWYEAYSSPTDGVPRFVYMDADIRENLDLWVQYQLRVVDAGLVSYRQQAVAMFHDDHPKDKVLGAVLIMVDQGFFDPWELSQATVGDLEFIDEAVKLLGRKLICDPPMFDFLTSIVANRVPTDPLFYVDTMHGRQALGKHYLGSVFRRLRMSPVFMLFWRASQTFARIMNRHSLLNAPEPAAVEDVVFEELQRVFGTVDSIRYMVDHKVKLQLLENYGVEKSLQVLRQESDDLGVLAVHSDLTSLRTDEAAFSEWLHTEPMHDLTPEQEQAVADAAAANAPEEGMEEGEQQTTDASAEGKPGGGGGAPGAVAAKDAHDEANAPGMVG